MRYRSCHVARANEQFYGTGDPFQDWSCILCGNICDPMIPVNRSQCTTSAAKGKKEGETFKYRSTGCIFEVKKRTDQFVIFDSLDGLTQILTGVKSIFDFFERNDKAGLPTSEMVK
jgi:hypothetical protein